MTKLWLLSANEIAVPRFSIRLFNEQAALPPLTAGIFSALYLIWVIIAWPLPDDASGAAIAELAVPIAATNADSTPDYLAVADWHLFGEDETVAPETTAIRLVATPLQLKLLGVFFLSGQSDNSYAIIQSADGMQQKYREGEALPEDAILQRIEKTRVVLKHLQRLESLAFDPNPISLAAPNQ
ncbi:MAG: hypothetical protein M0R33_06625 [Methylomonas sp.]|jgi:hypothetical protein|uniref:type II secretion system protein N n=1 Tax=Methylomonas sp. TaxID=418 RepID=UPI0025E80A67|nr:type II secretion system protein N [Methylomonas sp.]MCK9606112.1 hypothetical protein [Methylomonas sp.]